MPSVDLIDHRFFYVDSEGICRTLCPIVVDAAIKQLRMFSAEYDQSSPADFLVVLDRFPANAFMTSFAVKAAALSECSLLGLPIPKLQKPLTTDVSWS